MRGNLGSHGCAVSCVKGVESEAELDRRLRTCHDCGYVCGTQIEYHPYVFCVLVKAGFDPWQIVAEFADLRV